MSPAVGSYLGVLVDRLPRGEDTVTKPSECRYCGYRPGHLDLIPIVSFVVSKGACRNCGHSIPAWYLYIELLATGLAVLAVVLTTDVPQLLATTVFLWLLLCLLFTDARWFRLPNVLTIGLFIVGLVRTSFDPFLTLFDGLVGAFIGATAFWLIRTIYKVVRKREGLGLGDVKLMGGIGAGLGSMALPSVVLIAALVGLAVEIARASFLKTKLYTQRRVPFGAYLCGATILVWYFSIVFPEVSNYLALS